MQAQPEEPIETNGPCCKPKVEGLRRTYGQKRCSGIGQGLDASGLNARLPATECGVYEYTSGERKGWERVTGLPKQNIRISFPQSEMSSMPSEVVKHDMIAQNEGVQVSRIAFSMSEHVVSGCWADLTDINQRTP